jgi:hypothetical protein
MPLGCDDDSESEKEFQERLLKRVRQEKGKAAFSNVQEEVWLLAMGFNMDAKFLRGHRPIIISDSDSD